MSKRTVSLDSYKRLIHPMPTFVVTVAGKDGEANPITIDWLTPISEKPPLIAMAIMPQRHSYGLLHENPAFVINVLSFEQAGPLMVCGRQTGGKDDKWETAGLTPQAAEVVDVPAIKEAWAHIECVVENEYPGGDHVLIVARVVAAAAEPEMLVDGLHDIVAVPPVLHVGRGRLTTTNGKVLFIPRSGSGEH